MSSYHGSSWIGPNNNFQSQQFLNGTLNNYQPNYYDSSNSYLPVQNNSLPLPTKFTPFQYDIATQQQYTTNSLSPPQSSPVYNINSKQTPSYENCINLMQQTPYIPPNAQINIGIIEVDKDNNVESVSSNFISPEGIDSPSEEPDNVSLIQLQQTEVNTLQALLQQILQQNEDTNRKQIEELELKNPKVESINSLTTLISQSSNHSNKFIMPNKNDKVGFNGTNLFFERVVIFDEIPKGVSLNPQNNLSSCYTNINQPTSMWDRKTLMLVGYNSHFKDLCGRSEEELRYFKLFHLAPPQLRFYYEQVFTSVARSKTTYFEGDGSWIRPSGEVIFVFSRTYLEDNILRAVHTKSNGVNDRFSLDNKKFEKTYEVTNVEEAKTNPSFLLYLFYVKQNRVAKALLDHK